jgi:hypothetical protein
VNLVFRSVANNSEFLNSVLPGMRGKGERVRAGRLKRQKHSSMKKLDDRCGYYKTQLTPSISLIWDEGVHSCNGGCHLESGPAGRNAKELSRPCAMK